jgi:hypothetical protein
VDDGILSGPIDADVRRPASLPRVEAVPGLEVVDRTTGWTWYVVKVNPESALLRDTRGRTERVHLRPGRFTVAGRPVVLVPPRSRPPERPSITASGSVAVPGAAPRVARASRILVEGRHDAELVERVWGDDLRVEGIVVEPMDGMEDLGGIVRAFGPGPGRRLGILLDHLVPGTKEWRTAAGVDHTHVTVTGHPFVDVWQAIRPAAAGIEAWPVVPRGRPWKESVAAALGFADTRTCWLHLLGRVGRYTDLEPALVGAVELLIDFVTEDDHPR